MAGNIWQWLIDDSLGGYSGQCLENVSYLAHWVAGADWKLVVNVQPGSSNSVVVTMCWAPQLVNHQLLIRPIPLSFQLPL